MAPAQSAPDYPEVEYKPVRVEMDGAGFELRSGSVVIAAITSCTNTSNPSVMVAAGLLARNAVARGLSTPPWVKTSLAPGSRAVTDYLAGAGLMAPLEALGFDLVGYGCTTCIGNSGPLADEIAAAIEGNDLVGVAVLSGNRNFEGRIHPLARASYLASPPLVVAFALAGRIDLDLTTQPLGTDRDGRPVMLAELWPSATEIAEVVAAQVRSEIFTRNYASVFDGDDRWRALPVPPGDRYAWDVESTYVALPPFFEGIGPEPAPLADVVDARVLAMVGDSVTTDHISPAGSIARTSPAGAWLVEHGVEPREFNSYGARRGHHEVMMRGTFANIRLRNLLTLDSEGNVTEHLPTGERMSIFDAAQRYAADGTPLVLLAGKEYGSGSSRDWAAKGPYLLGVRAVIAESYERIHRSNLVGMGILPLQYLPGENAATLGLTGRERFGVAGIADGLRPHQEVAVTATSGRDLLPQRWPAPDGAPPVGAKLSARWVASGEAPHRRPFIGALVRRASNRRWGLHRRLIHPLLRSSEHGRLTRATRLHQSRSELEGPIASRPGSGLRRSSPTVSRGRGVRSLLPRGWPERSRSPDRGGSRWRAAC
jgi:aconitate hydratase